MKDLAARVVHLTNSGRRLLEAPSAVVEVFLLACCSHWTAQEHEWRGLGIQGGRGDVPCLCRGNNIQSSFLLVYELLDRMGAL